MSEFPSLPLFTDAYLADTRHLSAQEHGAYLLLLMMAWRSPECRLPNDDETLARWASVDVRTWKRIKPKVMAFWTLAEDQWSQARLTREREFVSKRADVARANGKLGGKPKRLKTNGSDNPAGSARATQTKAPNPNPITAATQQPRAWPVDRLIEAASTNGQCHQNLVLTVSEAIAYLEKGYDLERDWLPVVRAKASPDIRSWRFFGTIVEANARRRESIAPKPSAPAEDWAGRVAVFNADGTWAHAWGPKPGEPGCRVPPELLTRAA